MNKLNEMISSFPEAAKEYIKGKKLDEVECVIADLPGIARGKAVPATKFSRQKFFSSSRLHIFSNNNWWLGRSGR